MSGVAQKQPVLDDLAAVTEAAKAELDRAIALSGLQRDPLRHSFQALRVHLDAMHQLVSQHIEEARKPIGREDLQRLVRTVVGKLTSTSRGDRCSSPSVGSSPGGCCWRPSVTGHFGMVGRAMAISSLLRE